MTNISNALEDVRSSKEEVEETTKEAVKEALADSELVSVNRVGNANMEESVKLKLDYSGIEEALEDSPRLEGLEFSISGTTLQVKLEENSRF